MVDNYWSINSTQNVNFTKYVEHISLRQSGFGTPSVYSTRQTDELKQYMVEPIITLAECPLLWSKSRENRFPTLSRLARKYLANPASSASSERMWSISGLLMTKQRNRMQSENITQLMFIKQNSKVTEQLHLNVDYNEIMSHVSSDPLEEPINNV